MAVYTRVTSKNISYIEKNYNIVKIKSFTGIKKAIGLDMDSLNEQWKEYLKGQYWDEIGVRKNLNELYKVEEF